MENILFLAGVALVLTLLFFIGFKVLPKEKWQIIGALPVQKIEGGIWKGITLTYYGLFNAIACSFSVMLLFVLLGSVNISPLMILSIVSAIMLFCIPSSKIVAGWVEKKSNTLTIGGASFVGFVFLPWGLWFAGVIVEEFFGFQFPVITGLAAISIAYVFGESIGRLACVSFGCCYGKQLDVIHPILKRVFSNRCFVFSGKTKKIAYAHGLDGKKVLPIQAVTSIFYLCVGLSGLYMYLKGEYLWAFLTTVILSQIWRFLSEFFRADYRGGRNISSYQLMSLFVAAYVIPVSLVFAQSTAKLPVLLNGISMIGNPLAILSVQGIFVLTFLYTGLSKVTYAHISFFVNRGKI